MADVAAGAAPPATTAGGEPRPNAPRVADPPLAEPPGPRTRQELIASEGDTPFERYLAGPWYRQTQPDGDGPDQPPIEIIHFEPDLRHITFFDGEVQEIYAWQSSRLPTSSRIVIRMHNAHVTSVEKTLVAEVVADDELDVTVRGSESEGDSDLNGTYLRLGEAARNELVHSSAPQPGMAHLNLSGLYRDSDGQTIRFDAPRFTWQQHDRLLAGGFAIYSAGQPVIVFKVVSVAGATSDIRTYALEFREQRGPERVRRSLTLHPATLEITGLVAVGATALHFEQMELVDTGDADDAEADTPAVPAAGG